MNPDDIERMLRDVTTADPELVKKLQATIMPLHMMMVTMGYSTNQSAIMMMAMVMTTAEKLRQVLGMTLEQQHEGFVAAGLRTEESKTTDPEWKNPWNLASD